MNTSSCNKHIAAAAALALLCSLPAAQAGSDKKHGFDPEDLAEHMVERLDDRVDLSDAQESELKALIEDAARTIDQQRQQVSDSASEAFAGDSFSEQDAQAMLDGMEGVRDMRRQIMVQTIVKLHGILTPEQRAEAGKMLATHGGWFAGRGFHGGHGRRGYHDDDDHHDRGHRRRYHDDD